MADDNVKHDAAKEGEDRKQRVVCCKYVGATGGHGVTEAVQRMQTHLIARWKSRERKAKKKRHEAAMRLSIPQAPRWLVADEANKAACRNAPFPSCRRSHLDSIGPSPPNPPSRGPGAVVLLVRERYFVLFPPPLWTHRETAQLRKRRKKKSQTGTYQPFLKPSLMVARSSDDTQTPIWGNKRRGIDREGETCVT